MDRGFEVSSWDNMFASILYESGFAGLVATVLLYASLLQALVRLWRVTQMPVRDALVGTFASIAALVFMMTNVAIFARQLDYLFWALVPAAYALSGLPMYSSTTLPSRELPCDSDPAFALSSNRAL